MISAEKLIILDYTSGECLVTTLPDSVINVEDYITEELNYDLDNIHYMVTTNRIILDL